MKKNNIPRLNNPAPVVSKTEKTAVNARIFVKGKEITYDDALKKKKERDQRTLNRRYNALKKAGLTEEQIKEYMENEKIRTVMVLPYDSYSIQNGTKKKTVTKRDEKHHVVGKEEIEIPNMLRGTAAVLKFLGDNDIEVLCGTSMSVYFNTTKDKIEEIKELFKTVGRLYIYSWHPERPEEEKIKKPTNNTREVAAAAKKARKEANKQKAAMRPYYAALRKGGVSKRIKKYNKPLADKIEKWLKEFKAAEKEKAEKNKEYRAKHRQLTSVEMKANKKARKARKTIETKIRTAEAQKKRREANIALKEAKLKQIPVQTELKMAA